MMASHGVEPSNPGAETLDVIVVGAGVSGCACAATLAEAGARVMVVSSALDVVGFPSYGPAVGPTVGGWQEIEQVFGSLPAALSFAWLDTASVPENRLPLLVIDRRAVSIETKRVLELIPGLQFRQGLVSDIRVVAPPDGETMRFDGTAAPGALVEVETVFGERLRARMAVLAVGLSLGGTVSIGGQQMAGGRYGEVPATALQEALLRAGACFADRDMYVGARYGADSAVVAETLAASDCDDVSVTVGLIPIGRLLDGVGERQSEPGLCESVRAVARCAAGCAPAHAKTAPTFRWPAEFPQPPHGTHPFFPAIAVVAAARRVSPISEEGALQRAVPHSEPRLWGAAAGSREVTPEPVLLPDGAAMLEFYQAERGALADSRSVGVPLQHGEPIEDSRMVRPSEEGGHEAALGPYLDGGLGGRGPRCSPEGEPASRLEHQVHASILTGLDDGRCVPGFDGRVWAVGQVAGAQGYLASLGSGLSAAVGLLNALGMEERSPITADGTGAGDSQPGRDVEH